MLKSPIGKTSYLFQLILEKVDSMYSINLTESVLGCLYVQPQIIFFFLFFLISIHRGSKSSSVLDNSSILE